ncbi:hypothetical protein [Hyphomicrobium sp. CS1GBMeth3]|uniref:hypothetical protein n=1 Tax=Hyphomicrobium sp. CS1GBMeth3 TaxID=1892845 RepID=UPI000931FED6|nr:hypothetical protein [Hyphomicrobium sp. CS1GBMeth3]
MTNAELIAGFAGPIMMAVAAAMLINRRAIVGTIKDVSNNPGFIFFAGILTLLAGLAIVRTHNVWSTEWTVLVTVIGWLAIIGGIVRIVWPKQVASFSNKAMSTENAITAWALVALLLGAFLTAKGYALV